MNITAQLGHIDSVTAHVTFGYPFGRSIRCLRREWIEQAKSGSARGEYRFVTQTTKKSFNLAYTMRIQRDGLEAANSWAQIMLTDQASSIGWNAPKASTYSPIAVMVSGPLDDDSGRIGTSYRTIGHYVSAEQLEGFVKLIATELNHGTTPEHDALRTALERVARALRVSPEALAQMGRAS
ncbi:MAG TPA: hypothetical protein VNF68_07885 [Candidatus Baltobacteraceae bacterium]|nr:hypothetical protein [Candidatus Baltobacteraceae bacterium]